MKYFVVSDLHSFYTPFIKALKEKGFDEKNKNHTLVILGDVFDRGNETVKLYEYLKSVNQERLILVKGNHEDLFLDLLNKKYPDFYDFSNGTVNTFYQLAGKTHLDIRKELDPDLLDKIFFLSETTIKHKGKCYENWRKIVDKILTDKKDVINWLKSKKWKEYHEIGNYILVHSFIPIRKESVFDKIKYNHEWRTNTTKKEWFNARWDNPFKLYESGYFDEEKKKNKILVFGHWHCSYGNYRYHKAKDEFSNFEICKYENLIGIDACTAYSGIVNVLLIENK